MTAALIVLMTLLQQGWSRNIDVYWNLCGALSTFEYAYPTTSLTIIPSSLSINLFKWSLTIAQVIVSASFSDHKDFKTLIPPSLSNSSVRVL